MSLFSSFPARISNRLSGYDYSTPAAYFITICTHQRKQILSEITVGEGLAPPVVKLTEYGKIAEEQLLMLQSRYRNLSIDKYVIMPDHLHILLTLSENAGGASPSPTVPEIIGAYKSLTARLCKAKADIGTLWQRSFYDHVVRNQQDYDELWQYIDSNPHKQAEKMF